MPHLFLKYSINSHFYDSPFSSREECVYPKHLTAVNWEVYAAVHIGLVSYVLCQEETLTIIWGVCYLTLLGTLLIVQSIHAKCLV